ncbi:MAG: tetratricopeptide repeat protein [Pseudorhodoplanes sp.]
MCFLLRLLAVASVTFLTAPLVAQSVNQCESDIPRPDDDAQIRGATSFIEAGDIHGHSSTYPTVIANFLYSRANAYRRQRDYVRARADFDRAIALNPQHRMAHLCRADVHDRLGNAARAAADRAEAARLRGQ